MSSCWFLACRQAIRFTHPKVVNCFDSCTGKRHFGSGLCFAKGQYGQHVHNLLGLYNIICANSAATGANHLHFRTPTVLQMQKYILKAADSDGCESEQDRHHYRQVISYLQPLCSSGITASLGIFHKDSYIIYAYVTARLCKAWLSERKTYTPFPVANVNTNSRKNALNCKRPCSLVKLPCLALWVDISCSQVQEGLANTMLPFKVSSHAPFLNTLWSMSYPYRPNNSGRKACLQLATRENPFYQNILRIFIKHLQPPSWMHLSAFVNAPCF